MGLSHTGVTNFIEARKEQKHSEATRSALLKAKQKLSCLLKKWSLCLLVRRLQYDTEIEKNDVQLDLPERNSLQLNSVHRTI